MGPLVEATELSKALFEAGNNLFNPHSSTDAILTLLDKVEYLLSTVEQDPTTVVQKALIPSIKALVTFDLLRNPDSDVRVFVASCLTEIMRITAPEPPYNDNQITEIFKVTIEAFGKLADASCRSYRKAETVLDTVAKVRSSLVMLDLECDDLILEMFKLFLKIISPDHPRQVLVSMETIMITVIDESEEISMDMLDILLNTVKKDSLDVSPMALKLAEKVLSSCTDKLQPCILEALKSTGTSMDIYSPVVASICESKAAITEEQISINPPKIVADEKIPEFQVVVPSDTLQESLALVISPKGNRSKRTAKGGNRQANGENNKVVNGEDLKQLLKQGQSESTDAEVSESGSTRRRRHKPNSLMNPEEGYSFKTSSSKKVQEKELKDSSGRKLAAKKASPPSRAKSGSNKRSRSKMEETNLDVDTLAEPASEKQIVKKSTPEDEKPEDSNKTAKSSKKERAQNGLANASAKKPLAETKSVKTTPQSSQNKKKNSRAATPSTKESELTSKSQSKRKQPSEVETEPKVEYGEELVGKKVNVWWPMDEIFYEGVIESYSSRNKIHKVLYSDGETEELDLKKERFEILEDNSSNNEDKEIDLSGSVTLSDFLRKNKKAKKNKSISVNVEPSSSAGDRSSKQTTEKKDSVTNSTRQGKRIKSRAERNQKKQKVSQAMQKESQKDCDEKVEPEAKGEEGLKFEKEPKTETKTDGEGLKSTSAEQRTDGEGQEVAKEPAEEPKIDGEEPTSELKIEGQGQKLMKGPCEEPETEVQEQKSVKEPSAETISIEVDMSEVKESDKDRCTSLPETEKVETEAEEEDQRVVEEPKQVSTMANSTD